MKNLTFGRYYQSWIGDLKPSTKSEGSGVAYDFKTGPQAFKIAIDMSVSWQGTGNLAMKIQVIC